MPVPFRRLSLFEQLQSRPTGEDTNLARNKTLSTIYKSKDETARSRVSEAGDQGWGLRDQPDPSLLARSRVSEAGDQGWGLRDQPDPSLLARSRVSEAGDQGWGLGDQPEPSLLASSRV